MYQSKPICIRRGVIKESDGAAAVSKPQIWLAEEPLKITLHIMITVCHVCTLSDLLFGWLSPFPVSILISGRVNREHRPTQLPPWEQPGSAADCGADSQRALSTGVLPPSAGAQWTVTVSFLLIGLLSFSFPPFTTLIVCFLLSLLPLL